MQWFKKTYHLSSVDTLGFFAGIYKEWNLNVNNETKLSHLVFPWFDKENEYW